MVLCMNSNSSPMPLKGLCLAFLVDLQLYNIPLIFNIDISSHICDSKWDINSVQLLPDYMRICFLALYNMVNETVHYIHREQNVDVLPNLKKMVILITCILTLLQNGLSVSVK